MPDQQESRLFTREQKTGFVLLFIFALLAVGLGLLQMRNTIYGPFVIRLDEATIASGPLDEDSRLRQTDTDHDGLSDWDELNSYRTSPYLPDTDSDGGDDKDEIERGTDPLCPEGQACAGEQVIAATTTPGLASPLGQDNSGFDLLQNIGTSLQSGGAEAPGQTLPSSLQAMLQDPARLRAELIATGRISREALDKIDDATLMRTVKALLESQSGARAAGTATTSGF